MATQNFKLSLIGLTWLPLLQQFFLPPKIANLEKGDWNKYGYYCGTTSNPMAKFSPLANINFSRKLSPEDMEVINKVSQFKPEERKDGVCSSLEEWALLILKPKLKYAYNADEESEKGYKRTLDMRPNVFISNLDFSKGVGVGKTSQLVYL
jgi:hypothetical protein